LTSTKWYNLREFKRDLIRDLREVKKTRAGFEPACAPLNVE
jgi:hypothetical protein